MTPEWVQRGTVMPQGYPIAAIVWPVDEDRDEAFTCAVIGWVSDPGEARFQALVVRLAAPHEAAFLLDPIVWSWEFAG